jgi:hypothetical protein
MKKKLYLLLAMCIGLGLTQDLYSQEKPVRVGVVGGMNLSSLNMYVLYDYQGYGIKTEREMRPGIRIGGVFEFWPSEIFALHINALYQTKGVNYKPKSSDYAGLPIPFKEMKWDLAYMSVPVLGKVAFGDKVKFYLDFGPEFSFLLSAKVMQTTTVSGQDREIESDIKDNISSFELSGNFGFGVEFPISNLTAFVGTRGYLSLTDVFQNRMFSGIAEAQPGKNAMLFGGSLSIGIVY